MPDALSYMLTGNMVCEYSILSTSAIGVVPYALPGSVSLEQATLDQIRKHDVVLWEKHGTVAVGTDIMDAFDQTDILNKTACIYMSSRNMGFEPDGMTWDQMNEIRDVFHLPDERR